MSSVRSTREWNLLRLLIWLPMQSNLTGSGFFPPLSTWSSQVRRWHRIAEGENPDTEVEVPGFPPTAQWTSEIRSALIAPTG